jgi:DNA mismatch repair protein MutS2
MEIEVPLSDIRFKSGKSMPATGVSLHRAKVETTVSSRINLVGTRVDEALSKLEHFLNDAALAELQEVTLIHGVGKGLLMKAIHEHLSGHPLVRHFRSGTTEEGGIGVTVAKMK